MADSNLPLIKTNYFIKKKNNERREKKKEPFLASSVPNLRLDDLVIDVDAAGGEFDANGGFGFQAEFVLRESRQEVRFPNARVSDQHHLEQVVVIIVRSVRTHRNHTKDPNFTVFSLQFFLGNSIGSVVVPMKLADCCSIGNEEERKRKRVLVLLLWREKHSELE